MKIEDKMFCYSLQILSATILILRRIQRDIIKMSICLHVKYRLFWADFNETRFFFPRKIFEKCANITFHDNPSSGSRIVPRGQTDGHEKANSRSSQCSQRV